MKQRTSSPRKAQLLQDCTLGGKIEGERSMFRVIASGLRPLKGLEAGLNSREVLQPSAGQERSSLAGGRERSTWLPPGPPFQVLQLGFGHWVPWIPWEGSGQIPTPLETSSQLPLCSQRQQ